MQQPLTPSLFAVIVVLGATHKDRCGKGVCLVEAPVGSIQGKNLGSPDEVRSFDKGKMDVVTLDNVTVGLATFEPGWQWSECVKPIAGTDSCQVPHVGYVLSGRIKVVMDNGSEKEFGRDERW